MAEYLVSTEGNSFYYIEGSGTNMKISSLGNHSSLNISKSNINCAYNMRNRTRADEFLHQAHSTNISAFSEGDVKKLVGKNIFFGGPKGGHTSPILEIFMKIS